MRKHHVCPVWAGYLLASPIRALFQNPEKILAPHITPGMRVLDIGCGMGFFSLPLALLVGPRGRVICVDLQQQMLDALLRRARRAILLDRMETRLCRTDALGITDLHGQIHFALLFAVAHEVDDAARVLSEVHDALRPGGRVLLAEPKAHVREDTFRETVAKAERSGLCELQTLQVPWSRAMLLAKRERQPTPSGSARRGAPVP